MSDNYYQALLPLHFFCSQQIIHNAIIETLPHNYNFSAHFHSTSEFYLITEGICSMTIASEKVALHENEYIFIMPFVPHSIETPSNTGCTFHHIHFDLNFLNDTNNHINSFLSWDLYQHFIERIPFYFHQNVTSQILSCSNNILNEFKELFDTKVTLINFYLLELTLLLAKDDAKPFLQSTNEENRYVKKALQYIRQNFTNKILLQDIADYLGISVRYLTKIFSKEMYISVNTYINTYRIQQSIILMQQGFNFTEIAMNVGFGSLPHFTKTFTKIIGVTPQRYKSSLSTLKKML